MAKKERHTRPNNKWESYTFGEEPIALEPFDLDPVTDIPIRLAVEKGVVKRHRDLGLYKLAQDWEGHPAGSIVVAGAFEEGKTFAVWTGDGHFTKSKGKEGDTKTSIKALGKPASIPIPSRTLIVSLDVVLEAKIQLRHTPFSFQKDHDLSSCPRNKGKRIQLKNDLRKKV